MDTLPCHGGPFNISWLESQPFRDSCEVILLSGFWFRSLLGNILKLLHTLWGGRCFKEAICPIVFSAMLAWCNPQWRSPYRFDRGEKLWPLVVFRRQRRKKKQSKILYLSFVTSPLISLQVIKTWPEKSPSWFISRILKIVQYISSRHYCIIIIRNPVPSTLNIFPRAKVHLLRSARPPLKKELTWGWDVGNHLPKISFAKFLVVGCCWLFVVCCWTPSTLTSFRNLS